MRNIHLITHKAHQRTPSQRGASLIEVLVSALILSLGMLALVGVQVSTSQVSKITQFRGDAQRLGQDMADRIQANFHVQRNAANNPLEPVPNFELKDAYSGNDTAITVPDCVTTTCTAVNLAAMDLAEMRNLARVTLPRGDIRVVQQAIDANQTAINVWVLWQPARNSSDDSDAEQTQLAGLGCPTAVNVAAGTQCLLTRIELRT